MCDISPHTHTTYTYGFTQSNSHDTRAPGGAAAAAAAARAGGRIRTGRSSDRLGGRCSVCQSAPARCLRSERRQVQGSVAARGRAAAVASRRAARARRGGQVIGRRVMGRRVTAPSDRRRADRRSAAADLEGVRSATVGVGGRPSFGEEGGRQVRAFGSGSKFSARE